MLYLLVGFGGALGSMARAGLAFGIARITGPAFPWGTILINILGSFVIGFFGTLTAGGGRFALPADARAFVMVGFCGGFTTFSSFSLQTLDLARDGRVAQAVGNVVLSVALCLTAVAAGHYGAAALRTGRADLAASRLPAASRVALAVLNRPEMTDPLLDAASDLLRMTGGGRIVALAVCRPPIDAILPSEEVMTADREAAFRAEQEGWISSLRAGVTAWTSRSATPADWVDIEGDAAAVTAEQGHRATAIVIERPAGHEPEWVRDSLHAALFSTDRPVLVIPPGDGGVQGGLTSRSVAIAWKDDERAAKALRSSLPLLTAARAVHVLCAGEAAKMPPMLAEHGIAAILHHLPIEGHAGDALLAAAHQAQADLLVMGAFTHGEWRERLFGGVTRTMLAKADLPLWMQH